VLIVSSIVSLLVLLFLVTTSGKAQAPSPTPDGTSEQGHEEPSAVERWWDGKYVLGHWDGGRDRLEERGLFLDLGYMHNVAANPIGGRRQGITYADNVHFGLVIDLDKMFGWRGGRFTVNGLHRAGDSLSNEYIGNQYNVQQVFGGQTFMLYALHLEQRLLSEKLSIKAGRFAASDDFNGSPLYGLHMNHGINGFVRNVQLNTQYSVYPFATWALRLQAQPTPWLNMRVGVFHNSPNVFDPSKHGADFSIKKGDGFLVASQLSFTPRFIAPAGQEAEQAVREQATGHYWLGSTVSRYQYARFDGGAPERLSYGFYAHADQLVWREQPTRDEGLTLWLAGGYYPQQAISIVPVQVNAGSFYKGLFPRRGDDVLVAAVVYGAFGRDYGRALQRDAGRAGAEPSYELVVELAYKVMLRKFLFVQPDVQFIVRPAGTGLIDNALVLGVQTGMVF
jgi:porin